MRFAALSNSLKFNEEECAYQLGDVTIPVRDVPLIRAYEVVVSNDRLDRVILYNGYDLDKAWQIKSSYLGADHPYLVAQLPLPEETQFRVEYIDGVIAICKGSDKTRRGLVFLGREGVICETWSTAKILKSVSIRPYTEIIVFMKIGETIVFQCSNGPTPQIQVFTWTGVGIGFKKDYYREFDWLSRNRSL